ncbi:hypothetical protein QPK32_01510 [Massilia sp. YIM B02763]|uniref:hypothetical protein n=1 Tax=Massilia sp. YIM B02763 TaxID=3050130 RepID=UPI0025B6FD12|nr:hypothetical protein [Massilia sp. YIM B02763]MDN4051761.1 hypothetical protein [Massilia sp. YIM B02763]
MHYSFNTTRFYMTVAQQPVDISEFTLNDIHVGTRLYTALVAHALVTQGAAVFYSDILAQAKALDPHDEELQHAVPIGIGMKLLFVESFCVASGYPNLACLAVSRSTGRPSEGYKGDWETDRRSVAAFDWSIARAKLDAYVHDAKLVAAPKKRRSYQEAKEMRWEHYSANRPTYADLSNDEKSEILNLLIEGFQPELALQRVVEARNSVLGGQ